MRSFRLIPLLIPFLVIAACCSSCASTKIENEPDPKTGETPIGDGTVKYVVERHDDYITADGTLSDAEKAAALADSILVKGAFKNTLDEDAVKAVAEPLNRVISRHDAYVDADTKLSPSWKGLAKLQTRSLKRLVDKALGVEPAKPEPAKPVATPPTAPPNAVAMVSMRKAA
jgi:hypothetical protein